MRYASSYSRYQPEWTLWPRIRFWLEHRLLWINDKKSEGLIPTSAQQTVQPVQKELHPFMWLKPSSGRDSDSEESERLVNLGSIALREPDDSSDVGLSENGITSQDDFLNTGGQNARLDDPLDSLSEDEVVFPLWRSTRRKRFLWLWDEEGV